VNVWRRAGRWVAAALLLAAAPMPVTAGRLLLADRGATPVTATAVTVGVAATIVCLVAGAVIARLAYRAPRHQRPGRQPARRTSHVATHSAGQDTTGHAAQPPRQLRRASRLG
jgi:hypothetical protein